MFNCQEISRCISVEPNCESTNRSTSNTLDGAVYSVTLAHEKPILPGKSPALKSKLTILLMEYCSIKYPCTHFFLNLETAADFINSYREKQHYALKTALHYTFKRKGSVRQPLYSTFPLWNHFMDCLIFHFNYKQFNS